MPGVEQLLGINRTVVHASRVPLIYSNHTECCTGDICVFCCEQIKEESLPRTLSLSGCMWILQQASHCESVHPLLSSQELTFLLSLRRRYPFPIIAGVCIPLKAFPGITIKYLLNSVCVDYVRAVLEISNFSFFFRMTIFSHKFHNNSDGPV